MSNQSIGSVSISLDIEVSSSLEKQIQKVSDNISDTIKKNVEKSFDSKSIESSISKPFENVMKKASSIGSNIGKKISEAISKASKKTVVNTENIAKTSFSDRSIPKARSALPKSGVNIDDLTNQQDTAITLQENVNAQIDLLNKKLKDLARTNISGTMSEEMLKIEQRMISLTSKSDKLTVDIRNLDAAIDSFNTNQATIEVEELSNNIQKASFVSRTFSKVGTGIQGVLGKVGNAFKKTSQATNEYEKSSSKAQRPLINMRSIGASLARNFLGLQLMISLVGQGVRKLASGLFNALKSNDQFSSSLTQIKSNLLTAFMPIYNAILPAINSLMAALSTASGYLASFTSMLFGTTVKASNASAKSLAKATDAMNGYASASENAQGTTASFDQLNDITQADSSSSDSSTTVNPVNIDDVGTSKVAKFFESIKSWVSSIDFSPLQKSFDTLLGSLSALGGTVWDGVKWGIDNILKPLGQWVIEDALPSFLNMIGSALDFLNSILISAQPLLIWLWDNFLAPIANWTGGVIVSVMDGISNALDAISSNQIAMDFIAGFAVTLGLISAAMVIYNVAAGIGAALTTALATGFAIITSPVTLVIAAIAALVAIIYVLAKNWDTVMEWIKTTFSNIAVWFNQKITDIKTWFGNLGTSISTIFTNALNGVKNIWASVTSWFSNTVINPVKNVFTGLWDGLKNGASSAWSGIKNVFNSVGTFFKNTFSSAWTAVKNIFSTGGKIFDGIKDGIVSAFTSVVNTIISGINKVVAIPFNAINTALKKLKDVSIIGMKPFSWLPTISVPKIPTLANGGVLDEPTLNIAGEYAGASSNPEIVTPQNIMMETMLAALKEFFTAFMSNMKPSDQTIELIVNIGGKKFLDEIISLFKAYTKQTGKELVING